MSLSTVPASAANGARAGQAWADESGVRRALRECVDASARGDNASLAALWAPDDSADWLSPPHTPQRWPETTSGVMAQFHPRAYRSGAWPATALLSADVYVAGESAWAFTAERASAVPGAPDSDGMTCPGAYHFLLLDGRWRLTGRILFLGSANRAEARADRDGGPVRDLLAQYAAARARGDWARGAALWAPVPWALQASLAVDGALDQPGPHSRATTGYLGIQAALRAAWPVQPVALTAEVIQTRQCGGVAWAMATEASGERHAAATWVVYQLIDVPGKGWRIAAQIEVARTADRQQSGMAGAPAGTNGPATVATLVSSEAGAATAHGAAAMAAPATAGRVTAPSFAAVARRVATARASSGAEFLSIGSAAGAVLFGILGQLAYAHQPPLLWRGTLLYLLGIVVFALPRLRDVEPASTPSVDRAARRPGAHRFRPWRRARWRLAGVAVAALLVVQVVHELRAAPPLPSYNHSLVVWLAAIVLYVVAVSPLRWRRDWARRLWGGWPPSPVTLAMAGVLLAAFALRAWHAGMIPWTMGGDEGSQGAEALAVIKGTLRNPFTTGWGSVPTLSFYFNSLSVRLLGNTSLGLRLPWTVVGTVTVLMVFWLVRRLQGTAMALVTAALLATYHYHIHYSRLGSVQVADPLFVSAALLLLYRALDRRSSLDWALAGVVVGLANYFYAGARFTAIIAVVAIGFAALRDPRRFWREQRLGVVVAVGACVISAGPMIDYAVRFPELFNARVNQVGIFQSGWLEREMPIRHQGMFPILVDQFQRAALAFNVYPDRVVWYGSPKPLFDFSAGVLFLLGLGYATLRFWKRGYFIMVAWWWGAMIAGGMLTESPPSSMRLITLAPPAVFFVALALQRLGQLVQQGLGRPDVRRLTPYLALAVLIFSVNSVKWYFVDFTPKMLYGSFNGLVATAIGHYAHEQLGPGWRMYFFGAPRMYIDFGTIRYLAPEVEGVDVTNRLPAPPNPGLVRPDKQAAFMFLPERRDELNLVRQTFPDGQVEQIPSPLGGDPLVIVYKVHTHGAG